MSDLHDGFLQLLGVGFLRRLFVLVRGRFRSLLANGVFMVADFGVALGGGRLIDRVVVVGRGDVIVLAFVFEKLAQQLD